MFLAAIAGKLHSCLPDVMKYIKDGEALKENVSCLMFFFF